MTILRRTLDSDRVAPHQIESLWADLRLESLEKSPAQPGSIHARTQTLVTLAKNPTRELERAWKFVSIKHPGRLIALFTDPGVDVPAVVVEWSHPDSACSGSEMVGMAVKGPLKQHWAELVLPLLIPELPAYLWLAHPEDPDWSELRSLWAGIDHIILDTARAAKPWQMWAGLLQHRLPELGTSDLEWIRTDPWRQILASCFDQASCLALLGDLSAVTMRGSPSAISRSSWLMAWLGSRLDWNGGPPFNHLASTDNRPIAYHFQEDARAKHLSEVTLLFETDETFCRITETRQQLTAIVQQKGRTLFETSLPTLKEGVGHAVSEALNQGFDPLFGDAIRWLQGEKSQREGPHA